MQLRRLQLANETGLVLTGGTKDEAAVQLGAAVQAWLTRVGHDATIGAGLEPRVRAILEAIAPDLAKLWAVGVDSIADLLEGTTGTVRPLQAVRKSLRSGQKMTAAHHTALLHITRILHAGNREAHAIPRHTKPREDVPLPDRKVDPPELEFFP